MMHDLVIATKAKYQSGAGWAALERWAFVLIRSGLDISPTHTVRVAAFEGRERHAYRGQSGLDVRWAFRIPSPLEFLRVSRGLGNFVRVSRALRHGGAIAIKHSPGPTDRPGRSAERPITRRLKA